MGPGTSKLIVIFFLLLGFGSPLKPREEGEEDGGGATMESEELMALFEVMGDLLEDPTWAELHPHPCTDTPWPGIQCELSQSPSTQLEKVAVAEAEEEGQNGDLLHVTKLHIGPDVASPPCKPYAKLSNSFLKLPYLKTLSLFSCFLSPNEVSLPPFLFTNTSFLEQLVIKSNSGLSGNIPSSLAQVRNLRVLSLSQNNLHGVIPKELGALNRLEQLELSYNHLAGQIPLEIGGLTSLTIFDLSWNEVEGQIPWSIGQLQSLQKVDLGFNKLSGKIPNDLGELEKLVLLDLSHNILTGPIPETWSNLKELEYLLMVNNPINTTMPLFLGDLKKLVVLGLSGCGLWGPIPTNLGSLCNLTALSLDRNKLNGSIPASLGALPQLGQLNLSQNQLIGEISFSSEFVNKLGKRLDVRDNRDLCIDLNKYKKNISFNFEAPPCALDSSSDKKPSNNRPWVEEGGGVSPTVMGFSNPISSSQGREFYLLGFEMLGSLTSSFCIFVLF